MYFCRFLPVSERLQALWITPLRRTRLRLQRAGEEETHGLQDMLNRNRLADSPRLRRDGEGNLRITAE
ncbi:hypothetical protein [Aquisalimonas sp.]|uniref:hypothetical protein n=1 Tax=unclassified Aquisalimonas TaxID=2644645 RepID=UPI0025C25E74|nr:hypothetical protein [Aquisalimonas sp.]